MLIYNRLRRTGVPDSNIVLMLADDHACDARNPPSTRGKLFVDADRKVDVYEGAQVDYRGNDVSATNFLKVLSGRHADGAPANQHLDTDENSDVLIYLTGHGGDEFIKFRDYEELTATDMATAISQMHGQKRYRRLLLLADTCEADTLGVHIDAPAVAFYASSLKAENSYSHQADNDIGVLVVDRFTHHMMKHLEKPMLSLEALFGLVGAEQLMSHIGHKTTFSSPPSRALADDFMSGRLPDSAGTGAGYSSTGAFAIKASGEAGAAGASGLCGDHRQQAVPGAPPPASSEQMAKASPAEQLSLGMHKRISDVRRQVFGLACLALLIVLACLT